MPSYRLVTVLIPLLLLAGCASLKSILPAGRLDPASLAADVTIARDEWGVPHIFASTDAAVAFGLGYAQAEDDLWQIEEDYLHALGRASHWYGERFLASDLVRAAFEVERHAREEYDREPQERRALWDAFVAGLNHYIATSGARPRLITRYEPWMPFALARSIAAGRTVDGIRLGALDDHAGTQLVGGADTTVASMTAPFAVASLASGHGEHREMQATAWTWVVSPARSRSGHALMLHSDLGAFTGPGRPYEVLLRSDEGWHVRGIARLGSPVPMTGFNNRIAWSHTPSGADAADVFDVTFDHADDPLMYRFDGEWRTAVEWVDTLSVNSPTGVVRRVFTFRRTHHGPVVARRGDTMQAMRVARMAEGGSLQQLHAESRASTFDEFRAALDQRAVEAAATYADADGVIFHAGAGAVPVRDTAFDWRGPVDGSTSATDWSGYHALNDVPQLHNPPSGWIRTGDPFTASAAGETPDRSRFPRYMSAGQVSARARTAARRLAVDSTWTFEAWTSAAFDAYVPDAADAIAALIAEWEQVGGNNPVRARILDDAVDVLRSWDYVAHAESEAATLFLLWQESMRESRYTGEYSRFRAMEAVLDRLQREHGSTRVAWGVVNRLQRLPAGAETSGPDLPGLTVGGAPSWAGSIFTIDAVAPLDGLARFGVAGTRWIGAVELGPAIRSGAVVPFGQSGDSTSAHWFDQAPLFSAGRVRAGSFDRDAVISGATRVYSPGRAAASGAAVRELP